MTDMETYSFMKTKEPRCTEWYAQWCERPASQLMANPILLSTPTVEYSLFIFYCAPSANRKKIKWPALPTTPGDSSRVVLVPMLPDAIWTISPTL